jgi:hypothetical protein
MADPKLLVISESVWIFIANFHFSDTVKLSLNELSGTIEISSLLQFDITVIIVIEFGCMLFYQVSLIIQ